MNPFDIAFGTLALGKEYRILSMFLASDLLLFHPERKLYILTDAPKTFALFPNVVPIKHAFSGVRRCFHDKRFVIEKVLDKHAICVFLDADCRITAQIDFMEIIKDDTFILSVMMENLEQKIEKKIKKSNSKIVLNTPKKINQMFSKLSQEMNVQFSEINHISEGFVVFQKHVGNKDKFLKFWNYLSVHLSIRLYESGEGSSIGLSALAANCPMKQLNYIPSWLFNDEYTYFKAKSEDQEILEKQMASMRKSINFEFNQQRNVFGLIFIILRYFKNLIKSIRIRI